MKVLLVVVAMVMAGMFLGIVGAPLWLTGLPMVVGITYLATSRPSTQQQVSVTSPSSESTPTTESASEFSNVAFSEALPTWKGWSKEVGTVTIASSAVTVTGRKTTLTVMAPFTAEVIDQKYIHWPMVKVAGTGDSGHRRSTLLLIPKQRLSSTVYLVVRGAPAYMGALTHELASAESEGLASAINQASAI